MAYNNGIVLVVDEMQLGRTVDGGPGIQLAAGHADREWRPDHSFALFHAQEGPIH